MDVADYLSYEGNSHKRIADLVDYASRSKRLGPLAEAVRNLGKMVKKLPPVMLLPFVRNQYFTGRETFLNELHRR